MAYLCRLCHSLTQPTLRCVGRLLHLTVGIVHYLGLSHVWQCGLGLAQGGEQSSRLAHKPRTHATHQVLPVPVAVIDGGANGFNITAGNSLLLNGSASQCDKAPCTYSEACGAQGGACPAMLAPCCMQGEVAGMCVTTLDTTWLSSLSAFTRYQQHHINKRRTCPNATRMVGGLRRRQRHEQVGHYRHLHHGAVGCGHQHRDRTVHLLGKPCSAAACNAAISATLPQNHHRRPGCRALFMTCLPLASPLQITLTLANVDGRTSVANSTLSVS